jgi:hypothetical protein
MGTRDTYHEALVRACILAGDETQLAKRLNVPLSALVDWLLGDKPVPPDIFLRAVDLLLTAQKQHAKAVQAQVEATRDFVDSLRRRYR